MCGKYLGLAAKLTFVFFVCANSTPIIIRTGVLKSQGQHEDANVYDVAHHKGIANFEEDEGFNKDAERKHVASADSGHFGEENGVRKDHVNKNNFNKEQFFQHGGGGISDFGNKIAHKKGHHKSGFQNSYHKDEQGSNSSFFDDAEDEGDQYTYKTNKGTFGNMAHGRHVGQNLDNAHFANEGAKRGLYDTAGAYEKDLGNRQNYHRNNYYDGRENAGRRNTAADYGEGGRYQEEQYLDKPYHHLPHVPHVGHIPHVPHVPHGPHVPHAAHYVEPYPKPMMQRKKITIYEDPRYSRGAPAPYQHHEPPRYADDYIELDVRGGGPAGRYYNRRPPHYYY